MPNKQRMVVKGKKYNEKIEAIELPATMLLQGKLAEANTIIDKEYPFHKITAQGRNYTDKEKMKQFMEQLNWKLYKVNPEIASNVYRETIIEDKTDINLPLCVLKHRNDSFG